MGEGSPEMGVGGDSASMWVVFAPSGLDGNGLDSGVDSVVVKCVSW